MTRLTAKVKSSRVLPSSMSTVSVMGAALVVTVNAFFNLRFDASFSAAVMMDSEPTGKTVWWKSGGADFVGARDVAS